MTRRSTSAGTLTGPPDLIRYRLRTVARRLATRPVPAGVLFEWRTGGSAPVIVAAPAELLDPELVRTGPPEAVAARPRRWAYRCGVIRAGRPTGGSSDPNGPEGPTEAVPRDRWVLVQQVWTPDERSRLAVATRFVVAAPTRTLLGSGFDAVGEALAAAIGSRLGAPARVLTAPRTRLRDAETGRVRLPRAAWSILDPDDAARLAEWTPVGASDRGSVDEGHAVVFGASGTGKTTYLADRAAAVIGAGRPVLVLDLHGDLAPAVAARLDPAARDRLLAVDVTDRPTPGVAALVADLPPERTAAHLVAAVKRLSVDGGELHWGFRLERILDAFTRLALEEGGTLRDVYDLLTDGRRRDAARYGTRTRELGRFLEELEPIVRRTPDFLWPAAARLAKIVSVPVLAELLAPEDGGVPVESLLAGGRSLAVRLPFARLGSEAAAFAGTLLLARAYLGLAARAGARPPVTVVLDEVHAFAPRLVAEMLAESRKFGLRLLVATQVPERLAPELRSAAAGSIRWVTSFRVPPASAVPVGAWLGLAPVDAERTLPALPRAVSVARDPDGTLRPRSAPGSSVAFESDASWTCAVSATRAAWGASGPGPDDDAPVSTLLLRVLAANDLGRPFLLAPDAPDASAAGDLERRGWVVRVDTGVRLTPAGEARLGLRRATGATKETDAHRALIAYTVRIFARHGAALEIVQQGRFDTTLPDGIFRQLPQSVRHGPADALAQRLDEARSTWAWRFFGGRDVHVEAEVSGALRPERIRRGLAKARAHGAYALFVVGDADRARRVRGTLAAAGADRSTAQVWALAAVGRRPPERPDAAA